MSTVDAEQRRLEKELEEARARAVLRHKIVYVAPHKIRKEQRAAVDKALCAICGDMVSGTSLHLDHCHRSNRTRGWLCRNCNVGLGMFNDNERNLQRAIDYLRWHESLRTQKKKRHA